MLLSSFLHIPSIGASTEKKIWQNGICTMDDFVKNPPDFFSADKTKKIIKYIYLAKRKIEENDPGYFIENLPSAEHWRLFRQYRKTCAYIDIETTGLGFPYDEITTIALYDGINIKYYINGINLDDFPKDINKYRVLVTYNGKVFDIPFIENFFKIRLEHAHLDLRYILKSLGFSGGLKSCEKQLGIGRTGEVAEVDGAFAIVLWNDYIKNNNKDSLETLLSYNIEDVLNLEYLMVYAFNRHLSQIPRVTMPIKGPVKPKNPFEPHKDVIKRLKASCIY